MTRILIAGGPGAGKTTLARRLGVELGLPVIHSDKVAAILSVAQIPHTQLETVLLAEAEGETWIIDGGKYRFFAQLAARADFVIALEPPVLLRLWRLFLRPFKDRLFPGTTVNGRRTRFWPTAAMRGTVSWRARMLPLLRALDRPGGPVLLYLTGLRPKLALDAMSARRDAEILKPLRVERLGHLGDGIAPGPVFAPLTLPGELVEGDVVDGRMARVRILEAAPARQKPPCPHYRACGGCALQHARDDFVADWKADVVRQALRAQGLDAPISNVITSPPGSRRRATLHGRRSRGGPLVGFHGRASEMLCDVPGCLVLAPELQAALPLLRDLTEIGASRKGEVDFALTLCDDGLDLVVAGGRGPGPAETSGVITKCAGLARITWNGEVLASFRPVRMRFGEVTVDLPPGAFLQATREGEAALRDAVMRHTKGAARIADLFAGLGTFALPLSANVRVTAAEGDAAMVSALEFAGRAAGVTVVRRDLFRDPLTSAELAGFDALVIDPPRAGAEAQSREIARSDVPVMAAVSCNPVTFARDARILAEGGYRITEITVVDQFRWSAHVELVARLTKE